MFPLALKNPCLGMTDMWQSQGQAAVNLTLDVISFSTDFFQRAVLMADTLIQRGENSLEEHKYFSKYEMEMVLNGSDSPFPCNYHLMHVIPPEEIHFKKNMERPVLICPPYTRKPGIEMIAQVNQVSVAWDHGYEVYYLLFDPTPVTGQEIADTVRTVCSYIKHLNQEYPHPQGPILVGNCQAGWHSLLCGLYDPKLKYTLSAVGAPISYWSGEPGDDSLRFGGAAVGGAWVAAFLSDVLGGKIFDGANLSLNFDALHSEENFFLGRWLRTLLGIDTQKENFIAMEQWMTNYCQMSRGSILWIIQNLFIGNRLERNEIELAGVHLDMKNHPDLLVLLNSLGDNIATPWQCQCWIPTVWESVDAIKAAGKRIVILTHPTAGHLGIFFSSKVSQEWHGAVLKNMDELTALPPGLFSATPRDDGSVLIAEINFDAIPIPNQQGRMALEKAAQASEANLDMYETHVAPWVRAISPWTRDIAFRFHPYRLQRYPFLFAGINPLFRLVRFSSKLVKRYRLQVPDPKRNIFNQYFAYLTGLISTQLETLHNTKVCSTRDAVCCHFDC